MFGMLISEVLLLRCFGDSNSNFATVRDQKCFQFLHCDNPGHIIFWEVRQLDSSFSIPQSPSTEVGR
jgi:hypothetical protein